MSSAYKRDKLRYNTSYRLPAPRPERHSVSTLSFTPNDSDT